MSLCGQTGLFAPGTISLARDTEYVGNDLVFEVHLQDASQAVTVDVHGPCRAAVVVALPRVAIRVGRAPQHAGRYLVDVRVGDQKALCNQDDRKPVVGSPFEVTFLPLPSMILAKSYRVAGARDDQPIEGCSVHLRRVVDGYKEVVWKGETDDRGFFHIDRYLPAGLFVLTVRKGHWWEYIDTVCVIGKHKPLANTTRHIFLTPHADPKTMMITLSWGDPDARMNPAPYNLSLHLRTRDGGVHVWNENTAYERNAVTVSTSEFENEAFAKLPAISLDHSERNGYGPETLTIRKHQPDQEYQIWVTCDSGFHDGRDFSTSDAQVSFAKGKTGPVRVANAPGYDETLVRAVSVDAEDKHNLPLRGFYFWHVANIRYSDSARNFYGIEVVNRVQEDEPNGFRAFPGTPRWDERRDGSWSSDDEEEVY